MADSELKVKITSETSGLKKGLDDADKSVEKFSLGVVSYTAIAAAGFAAVTAAVIKGYQEYSKSQKAVDELNQSMINAGTYSAALQNKYVALAGALQEVTLYGDDQTTSAISLIQSHIGAREVTEGLIKATQDLATAKKMDLGAAAELVGKAISGEQDVLKRYGITVDSLAFGHDKLAAVTDALSKKFGGQAETAAKNSGQIVVMKNSFNDLLKVIGEKIAPAVNSAAGAFASLFQTMSKFFGGGSSLMVKSIDDIRKKNVELYREIYTAEDKIAQLRSKPNQDAAIKSMIDVQEKRIAQYKSELTQLKDLKIQFEKDIKTSDENAAVNKANTDAQAALKEMELRVAMNQQKNMLIGKQDEELQIAQLESWIKTNNDIYKVTQNDVQKLALLKQNAYLEEQKTQALLDKAAMEKKKKDLATTTNMMQSNIGVVKAIGKAAALQQIAIDTPKNANAAYGAMVGIPVIGPALATIAQVAAYAFGAEQAAKVLAANQGGVVTGGISGIDSVPAMLTPGELVVPQQNFDEVINAVSSNRDGGGSAQIVLTLKDDLMDFIEAKLVERDRLGISIQGA